MRGGVLDGLLDEPVHLLLHGIHGPVDALLQSKGQEVGLGVGLFHEAACQEEVLEASLTPP